MANIKNTNGVTWIPENEPLIEMISAAAHFKPLDHQSELNTYVNYLTYRVQRDLYEAFKAAGLIKKWTWDEFVRALCSNQGRETVLMVAFLTLKNFLKKARFNFGATEINCQI